MTSSLLKLGSDDSKGRYRHVVSWAEVDDRRVFPIPLLRRWMFHLFGELKAASSWAQMDCHVYFSRTRRRRRETGGPADLEKRCPFAITPRSIWPNHNVSPSDHLDHSATRVTAPFLFHYLPWSDRLLQHVDRLACVQVWLRNDIEKKKRWWRASGIGWSFRFVFCSRLEEGGTQITYPPIHPAPLVFRI
jgi:hypothetical protein